jgi:hypothetical protein
MREQSFWMVYVDGASYPTKKHDFQSSAEVEARRLAKKLKTRVYVLEAKKSIAFEAYVEKNLETQYEPCRPCGGINEFNGPF